MISLDMLMLRNSSCESLFDDDDDDATSARIPSISVLCLLELNKTDYKHKARSHSASSLAWHGLYLMKNPHIRLKEGLPFSRTCVCHDDCLLMTYGL